MIIKNLDMVFKTLDGSNMKTTVLDEAKKDELDETGNVIHKKGAIKQMQKDLIFRDAMTNVLLTEDLQACKFCGRNGAPEQIPGEEKARRCYLSMEIHKANNEVDLDREDIKLIKELIGKFYPSLIVGPAWKLLELPEEKKS